MTDILEVFKADPTKATRWIFFRLISPDGASGIGEATVLTPGVDVLQILPEAIDVCNRCSSGWGAKLSAVRAKFPHPEGRAIASALEQAWLDRIGKATQQPLHVMLGGHYRDSIPCYANINRGTTTRTPKGFAERAQAAVDAGYNAIKIAPFDGVSPNHQCNPVAENGSNQLDELARSHCLQQGFEKIATVAEQLQNQVKLYVDCHARLRVGEVSDTIDYLAGHNVKWVEEPVNESSENLQRIAAFRNYANAKGIQLAGAENSSGLSDFTAFTNAACYDVLMPDIIIAGGPLEVLRMGYLAQAAKTSVSLHNPCGPVMDVMSAHVAAALPQFQTLERQVNESPLYSEIISQTHAFTASRYELSSAPGAGCELKLSHPAVNQVACLKIML